MSVTAPSAFKIEQAMAVANAVKQRMLQDDPDLASDETLLRDTLDGETDVYDLLRRLARFALDAEAMAEAAKQREANLTARRKRFDARAQAARGAIFAMMDALGEKSIPDAEFTLTIKAGRMTAYVIDEDALPEQYIRVTRSPDRTAIATALKSGEVIPGAELFNAAPSLQIKAT